MGFETLPYVYSSAGWSVLSPWDVCTSLHEHPILYASVQYYCTGHFLLPWMLVGTLEREELLAEPQK